MSEAPEVGISEQKPTVTEVQFSGFSRAAVRELHSTKDLPRIEEIEKIIEQSSEYDTKSEKDEPIDAWLLRVAIPLSSMKPKAPEFALGIAQGDGIPKNETVIASVDPKTSALIGYVEVSDPYDLYKLSEKDQKEFAGKSAKDISFVTDTPDSERSPEVIAEGIQQSILVLIDNILGKPYDGQFTDEDIAIIKDRLVLFANAGVGDDEIKYRKALEDSGFRLKQKYSEEDEETKIVEEFESNILDFDIFFESIQKRFNNIGNGS